MNILDLKEQDYEKVKPNSERWLLLDNLKNEYWKDITGFIGLYQVSNYGRVKSLKRKTNNHYCNKDRILRPGKNKNGYHIVVLCKNKKKYTKKVHILVATEFIPNIHNKPIIDHDKPVEKDYCNNCVYNLRWATYRENSLHSIELGRAYNNGKPPVYHKKSKDHHSSKAVVQYDLEGNFIKQWWCLKDIKRELGLCDKYISQVIHNKKYVVYNYIWKFGIYEKGGDVDHEDYTK